MMASRITRYYTVRAGRRNGQFVYHIAQRIHSTPPVYRAQFWVGPDDVPTQGRDFDSAVKAIEACRLAGAWEQRP